MQVERIVSLVPSLTELVCGVGLEYKLVGCTKFCTDPPHLRHIKTIVGGTKNVYLERIYALNPDLILAAKEENTQAQVEDLSKRYPTYVTDIKNMPDMAGVLQKLLDAGGNTTSIEALLNLILQSRPITLNPVRALYLIWKEPYMSVGGNTYISSMLEAGGFMNVLAHAARYPVLELEMVKELAPDVILLSSEPFPFKESHQQTIQLQTGKPCRLVDGRWFSWYDSRIESHLNHINQLADSF